MTAATLFSGSGGNSFFLSTDNSAILIDAGVSMRRLKNALSDIGADIGDISAIFITHEHIDHIRGLESIAKRYNIDIHMTEMCARSIISDTSSPICPHLIAYRDGIKAKIGDIFVRSFHTSHDAADPVGYVMESGGVRIGLATDTGYITSEMEMALCGCNAAVIEANHDLNMLMSGPYPYSLKRRIMSKTGHLSNDDAAVLAAKLCKNGARSLLLSHMSGENNVASIALSAVKSAVGEDIHIDVAKSDEPTMLKLI